MSDLRAKLKDERRKRIDAETKVSMLQEALEQRQETASAVDAIVMPNTMIHFGFFDSPEKQKPTHDPGTDVNCPVCLKPLKNEPMKTISFHSKNSEKSWFYRIHKNCSTPEVETKIESLIIDFESRASLA